MQKPRFSFIDKALHFTSEYFQKERIIASISKLGGGLNLSYLDTYYEITLHSHADMEAEINQNIYGSNKNIQREMFEYLKDWLDNAWFFKPNADYKLEVEWYIENHNIEAWAKYEAEILAAEEKWKLYMAERILGFPDDLRTHH